MFIPKMHPVRSLIHHTKGAFQLTLEALEERTFFPGQFDMLYLFGYGEVPMSISGDPNNKSEISYTIQAVGPITAALQRLEKGSEVGVRGPFGNHWPLIEGKEDVMLIAGGLGLAPLRPALLHILAHKNQYGKITLLYGAKTSKEILYVQELQKWKKLGVNVQVTADIADAAWKGKIGVVTTLIHPYLTSFASIKVFLCGPEVMMHYAIKELIQAKVDPSNIYLSLERNMECAIGFCGHCQYGPYFLCKDGPIFPYDKVKDLMIIKEL